MKGIYFSSAIKACLQVIVLLAVLSFSFGGSAVTIARADVPNDLFENATTIGSLPFNESYDTTSAHTEVSLDEPDPGSYPGGCEGDLLRDGLATVWYSYTNTSGSNIPVFIDTAGSTTNVPNPQDPPNNYEYDTYIAAYTGTTFNNLVLRACSDSPNNDTNQAQLAFMAAAGTTYHIQVAEYDGVFGDNHIYPGYNGGNLVFSMTAGLTISGNLGIGGTSGAKAAYPGGVAVAGSNGDYILAIPAGFTGTVTASLTDTTFTPEFRNYSAVGTSQTAQNYLAKRGFNNFGKWIQAFDLAHGWTVSGFVRTVGDVNADGRDDLVGFGQDGVYVSLSTGSTFPAPTKWTSSFDLSHGWTVQDFVRTVGDVNGDGRADLVGFGLDGVYVSLSTGSSFPAPTKWTSSFDLSHGWTVSGFVRTVGDVNGDGRDDLVGFGLDGVYVSLSTGSGFPAPTKWTSSFDLSHGWTVSGFVRTVGDINADGRDDLVGFGQDGVYVSLSTGSGFPAPTRWIQAFDLAHGWTVADFVRTVGDVNGDGKIDLVGFGLDGVYISISTGSGFSAISRWTSRFDLSHGWTVSGFVRTVGDVNGDGLDDLVGFGLDGVYIGR